MSTRDNREWMSGAIFNYSRRVRNSPEAQDDIAFGICRDLGEYGVLLYDTKQSYSFAAVFNIYSPSRRSANKLAGLIVDAAITDYDGDVRLKGLSVIPKEPEHDMIMRYISEHTWPQLGQFMIEDGAMPLGDNAPEQLAQIIPINAKVRPQPPLLRRAPDEMQIYPTEVIPIYPAVQRRRNQSF